jgi:hypothetical protein
MIQKICFDCFHKLFPDKPIRKVTLGRQCVVCKAQTDRTEQMIPVEAEDIPLVKQIAQVPQRVLHRRVNSGRMPRGGALRAYRAAWTRQQHAEHAATPTDADRSWVTPARDAIEWEFDRVGLCNLGERALILSAAQRMIENRWKQERE